MQREVVEGTLRSEFGMQRLPRVGETTLNRVQLFPREAPTSSVIVWHRGAYRLIELEREDETRPADVWGAGELLTRGRALEHGVRLIFGATEVVFEERRASWPVDVAREAALASADRSTWQVFTDELLARGDPLGAFLSGNGERDVSFLLDVAPWLSRARLMPTSGAGGEWRKLTFTLPALPNEDWDMVSVDPAPPGLFEATLTHPASWFVEEVQLDMPRLDELDEDPIEHVNRAIDELSHFAHPHLKRFVLPIGLSAAPATGNRLLLVHR